ncbi:MAG: arginine deiminase [Planctomycetes bacterium]|nr:arginine deiminase [Planctomycetota bacterium]
MQLNIKNEYDRLEAVLVHRPGEEIDRLTHDNMSEYLFEDIPYLRRMQDEHDAFCETMRNQGIQVLYLATLLAETLENQPNVRRKLIETICAAENVPAIAPELLDESQVSTDALMGALFRGLTVQEYRDLTGKPFPQTSSKEGMLFGPTPNAYFTRDPAVVVRESVISCKMHYVRRLRETIITRSIFEHHPEFAGHEITYGGSDSPTEDRPFTIEGGDIIILNEEAVLVGASERTRSETIEVLAQKAIDVGGVQRFYEIPIPTERLFMHLDTVFTIVDHATVVWYPGVMENLKRITLYTRSPSGEITRKSESRNLHRILSDEFGKEVRIIETAGGDEHYASREQRTDGTNVFAIGPRRVIGYDRNERTLAALADAGIECFNIQGSELVRGLGGPRCMTMPLRRSAESIDT